MFCLSEIYDICKPPVDAISKPNFAVYNSKVSSHYSPDRKKPFFSNSHLRRPLLRCRKATVRKMN